MIATELIVLAFALSAMNNKSSTETPPAAVALAHVERLGAVRFENVSFTYEHGREILQGVSFEVPPSFLGRDVTCLSCSKPFVAPKKSDVTAAPPPPKPAPSPPPTVGCTS